MNVLIKKRIHANMFGTSSADVILERWVEMPFTPFIDLVVWYRDFEATIEEVNWMVGTEFIECWTESHKEERSIDEIVEEFISMGWKRA